MASSCSYKDVGGNACVLAPRSCRECLNEPLPSGEVCALSPLSGLCVAASAISSGAPLFSGVQSAAEPLLSNATVYCGAEDAECVSCLAQTHSSGDVCSGKFGCVCVGICENDLGAWEATTTLLLSRLLGGRASISGGSRNTSDDCSSSLVDPEISLFKPYPPAKSERASDNECMWRVNTEDECLQPRSCYDCLNAALPSGQECMITPQGYCSTMDAYNPARDFRLNGSASASHYFPARNATYCEPTDATCAECARSSFVLSDSGRIHPSQFCVGAGGCVCVGFCESPDYAELVQSRMCAGPTGVGTDGGGSSSERSDKSMHMMASAIVLSALVLVSLALWLWRKARAEARRLPLDSSREPRAPQFGPPLELTAWKERRDELIARETAETLGAPSYDSSCAFYLTPPTTAPVAVMGDEEVRGSSASVRLGSGGLYAPEHEWVAADVI